MENIYLTIVLAPLVGAILAGLFGKQLGRVGAHSVTILGVGVSFLLSLVVFKYIVIDGNEAFNGPVYTWMVSEGINMQVGFLVDKL
ncbi:MAG: NADH-quinone oxidoreductase subunit L, partial [Gammaproteobacteria bacterium]|nr:NADH-quinone oxidoreductase subunit L [Gammaproteobacteria bacterium]